MRRGWLFPSVLLALALASLAATNGRPAAATGATEVGSDACKDCHESHYNLYVSGSHGRAEKDGAVLPMRMSCESCHGPGSLHVEADGDRSDPGFATMRNFTRIPVAEANANCLACHGGGGQFYWNHSAHDRKDMACIDCHSMHSPRDPGHAAMLKTSGVTELCITCHKSKHLTMSKSAHMPVREGGMDCADCHNPHGTATPYQVAATTTQELCLSCHADKRGPMLWEHAPVREDCMTCHEPHGANNDKVLTTKRPFLCQRCHIAVRHPGTLYDGPDLASNRLFNRSCTNCHTQVHGSNHPSGKFFLR